MIPFGKKLSGYIHGSSCFVPKQWKVEQLYKEEFLCIWWKAEKQLWCPECNYGATPRTRAQMDSALGQ